MMSTMSFSSISSTLRTNEDAKEKLLCAMKIAVKEVQYYYTENNTEDGLSANTREVLQLCDSLDKTLFHGLREYQKGYWPFVKDFTHSNIVSYIEGLDHSLTEIQRGRSWLCLALNENSLESYFRSFQQNPSLVQKYYSQPALLRDNQRMQLVLMHMSGLENVHINLDLENINCGSGLSFFSSYAYKGLDFMLSTCSNDFPMYEYQRRESESSFRDNDSGVIGCENAVDMADGSQLIPDESKANGDGATGNVLPNVPKHNSVSSENEIERITKYLNMSPETEGAPNDDLEVIRTKVVRRFKKSSSQKNTLPEVKKGASCPENLSKSENADTLDDHRLSKATTDSGLSLETHSSSDRDSPELTYENFHQNLLTFDVLSQDIAVKFSTPSKKKMGSSTVCEGVESQDFTTSLEERGDPEGQESHLEDPSSQSTASRQPLLPGDDGLEDEEISIYDISKNHNRSMSSTSVKICQTDPKDVEDNDDEDARSEISSSICSTIQATPDHCIYPIAKVIYKDPVDEELKELLSKNICDTLDIRLDNSTLLYLVVEVFEHEEEEYYKVFQCYLRFPMGNDQISLILLTNKSLYVLELGNSDQKFILHDSMAYSDIDSITVQLNYQGFTLMSKNFKQVLKFYTADEYLTRSIISNLEVAIRRSTSKHILPAVSINGITQIRHLKKFMASQLHCLREDVSIHHFVLAWWEDYNGNCLPETPAGPRLDGNLMYRHKFSGGVITLWQPGFFILNGGVLYCMEEEVHTEPLFFIQMWVPHCKGCRRLHAPVRPYAFEVILSNGDSLQLAAADELEACKWQQAFLETVSLAGHLIDCSGRMPTSCCVVIFNDHISVVEEMTDRTFVKCIGLASVRDLVSVCTSTSIPTCLYMLRVYREAIEIIKHPNNFNKDDAKAIPVAWLPILTKSQRVNEFEITEADKSCGEWIISFDSEHEKEKFIDVLKWRWSSIFQSGLKISSIKDLSLTTKIQQNAHSREADKKRIRDYCYEN